MMRKAAARLRAGRGETLVESLVSILVFTFASILFLSMVASAANINRTVQQADLAYQAQQAVTETGPGAAGASQSSATVTVTCGGAQLCRETVTIVRQEGAEDSIYAYYLP